MATKRSGGPKPLTEFIPPALLAEEVDLDLVRQVALLNLVQEGASIDKQISFLTGLKEYHALISDESKRMYKGGPTQGWRWYSDTVSRVERFTRESNGKYLGTKVRIFLSSGEDIDTDWVDFAYATGDPSLTWQLALSQTIEAIATRAVGKKVSMLKHVFSGNNGKGARTVINMKINFNQGDDDDDNQTIDMVTIKGARKVAESLDIKVDDELDGLLEDIVEGINSGEAVDSDAMLGLIQELLKDDKIKNSESDVEAWEVFEEEGLGKQLLAYGISLADNNLG